jgi:hypothetical protein
MLGWVLIACYTVHETETDFAKPAALNLRSVQKSKGSKQLLHFTVHHQKCPAKRADRRCRNHSFSWAAYRWLWQRPWHNLTQFLVCTIQTLKVRHANKQFVRKTDCGKRLCLWTCGWLLFHRLNRLGASAALLVLIHPYPCWCTTMQVAAVWYLQQSVTEPVEESGICGTWAWTVIPKGFIW